MKRLVSKLQEYYYEKGEFSASRERSLEETLALIRDFKWPQVGFMVAGLDGPSIAIEDGAGSFLKIGHYYHNRFCIYWLNNRNKLLPKVVETQEEMEHIVKAFFEGTLDAGIFGKYVDWMFRKREHFATGSFVYRFRLRRSLSVMITTILFTPVFISGIILNWKVTENFFQLASLLCMYLVIGGVDWMLFLNYYFFSKDKVLILSKGTDVFSYGPRGAIKAYRKEDIKYIKKFQHIYKKRRRTHSGTKAFCIFEIGFKDKSRIRLTNLTISESAFDNKFPDHGIRSHHKFIPWLRKEQKANN